MVRLPDTDDVYAEWRRLVVTHGVSGKKTHDARLVAAMTTEGIVHILTFNSADFRALCEHALPGRTTVDLSLGKSLGETWSATITAINAANRRVLLDNSQAFGGMHFIDPRQLFVQAPYRFRY